MRKSWAEYKRNSRKRIRTRQKREEQQLNNSLFRYPYSDFLRKTGRIGFATQSLMLGDSWWDFSDDTGLLPSDDDVLDAEEREATSNSLGKAELVLDILCDIVETLAADISAYKLSEVDRELRLLSSLRTTTADAADYLQKLELLKKMRLRLGGNVRLSIARTTAFDR